MDKATEFFRYGALPELVGKWYTHLPSTQHEPQRLSGIQTSSSATSSTLEIADEIVLLQWRIVREDDLL